MKHSIRLTLISSLLLATGVANAGWSANVGWASDYYFRGILQSPTSPNGGFDYESDTGFYAGTWAADADRTPGGDGRTPLPGRRFQRRSRRG